MTLDEMIREATAEIVNNFDRWRSEYAHEAGEYPTAEGYDNYLGNHVRAVLSTLSYRSHDSGWYAALGHVHDLATDVMHGIAAGNRSKDHEHGFMRCYELIEQVIDEGNESK